MKYIITESRLNDIVIKWLDNNFNGLVPYELKRYPNFIFYRKNGQIIFDYNKKNGTVYISYEEIWSFLKSMFGMNFDEIQELTKEWVEEHYNLKVTSTYSLSKEYSSRWKAATI
jgi:hypothetical protein